ncbi:metalloregulator ArsR/SmtB family transcription factor [Patescibacteria group bacterium]|nr:metalloregulator ArsR/SmtB family transcription factor [Patescibacteria group bacterium]MBU1967369.1 metalloregulator ArsR/SmtB family transcription factor [Patescibacteria group bacterium]MBU2543631.1 metalloregulator ArsR/SmtB family transcription factor [Patescibacteria group bacterium]
MYNQIFKLHAQLLKALSHPKRLEIIHLIRDQELPVSDIHTMLDLPQANISQHLIVLRDAGVVKSRRDGKQIYYSLSDKNIIKASDLLRLVLIDQRQNLALIDELTLKMNDLVPLVHDPVCQMRLSPQTAGFSYRYSGKTHYFCASGCMKKFKESPGKYAKE